MVHIHRQKLTKSVTCFSLHEWQWTVLVYYPVYMLTVTVCLWPLFGFLGLSVDHSFYSLVDSSYVLTFFFFAGLLDVPVHHSAVCPEV